jgi:hypothetical protein
VPFDILVMRALVTELAPTIAGSRIRELRQDDGVVYCALDKDRGGRVLAVHLAPRFRRMHWVSAMPRTARLAPWAAALSDSRVEAVEQPPWERVLRWRLQSPTTDGPAVVVIELAGHLTNFLWLKADGRVGDAWRRVGPERPGRTIWPGYPYEGPPPVADPCLTRRPELLPPPARLAFETAVWTWEELCRRYDAGAFEPWVYPPAHAGDPPDLGAVPTAQATRYPGPWTRAVAEILGRQEAAARLQDLRRQATTVLMRRRSRLVERLRDLAASETVDPEPWRRLGDTILAMGPTWVEPPPVVVDMETGEPHALPVEWHTLPYPALAARAYQQYRKERARREAARRMRPRLAAWLSELDAALAAVEAAPDASTLKRILSAAAGDDDAGTPAGPYRRFRTARGTEVWVGRNDDENMRLTFGAARPDDLWFHVKQYPGSHVILRCGKATPHPEDIQDAAQLAVFFSAAREGAGVPVDYTRRKFVRKQPHGRPGAVLYTQERTVYVTPDEARLALLGARRERLGR